MILEVRTPGRRASQANYATRRILIRFPSGEFLHMNGQTRTRDRFWAWLGTKTQTRAMIKTLGFTPGVDVRLIATVPGGRPVEAQPEDDTILIADE